MASNFKNVNRNVIQGDGVPATGDGLCSNLSLFPVGTIYVNTETGILYVRNTTDGDADDWVSNSGGGGSSYLSYVALLTQTGTNAPVATVLENSLGGTPIWGRDDVGKYTATLSGAFTINKTVVFLGQPGTICQVDPVSDVNVITIYTLNNATLAGEDSWLGGCPIEIRVYP